jgi:hypothetical protein
MRECTFLASDSFLAELALEAGITVTFCVKAHSVMRALQTVYIAFLYILITLKIACTACIAFLAYTGTIDTLPVTITALLT